MATLQLMLKIDLCVIIYFLFQCLQKLSKVHVIASEDSTLVLFLTGQFQS